jgi:hypothetical protein
MMRTKIKLKATPYTNTLRNDCGGGNYDGYIFIIHYSLTIFDNYTNLLPYEQDL